MKIDDLQQLKQIIEATLMAADKPLGKRAIKDLFDDLERPDDTLFDQALEQLSADTEERGYELVQVASGYRFQVKQDFSRWVSKLWKEKAPRYSRALLETLSLIAYRQPITRGEIEDIRGVAVSTQIIKTLLEREWVKVVGHREVPGRPAIYATTKQFLDYFNLKSLDQLPPLAEIRDLNSISRDFNIELPLELAESANDASAARSEADVSGDSVESTGSEDAAGAQIDEQIVSDSVEEQNSADLIDEDVAVFEEWVSDELVDQEIDEDLEDKSVSTGQDQHAEQEALEASPSTGQNINAW